FAFKDATGDNHTDFFQKEKDHDIIGFKIQVVEDETRKSKSNPEHPFWPRLEQVENYSAGAHPNSVYAIKAALMIEQITHPELSVLWKTRKFSPFVGLWMYCTDLEKFKSVAKPDKQFKIENEIVYLLEMGPNSLDLLVSEKIKAN
ncbi:MAG: hypothetical protein ACK5V3_13720, partial [Bdellovibrionales bacterium]